MVIEQQNSEDLLVVEEQPIEWSGFPDPIHLGERGGLVLTLMGFTVHYQGFTLYVVELQHLAG